MTSWSLRSGVGAESNGVVGPFTNEWSCGPLVYTHTSYAAAATILGVIHRIPWILRDLLSFSARGRSTKPPPPPLPATLLVAPGVRRRVRCVAVHGLLQGMQGPHPRQLPGHLPTPEPLGSREGARRQEDVPISRTPKLQRRVGTGVCGIFRRISGI